MNEAYQFPSIAEFRDREEELLAIDRWYDDEREWRALMLYGRRRVGKSWLFRKFAHARDADIFVASTRGLADQLDGFSAALERDGERPVLGDLESFFRLLYRRARNGRRIAIIDEVPYLWRVEKELPSILLKVMEEEAPTSRLKLVLAGSHVGMMERLLTEREPLHDRLRPLRVRPLDFWHATAMLAPGPPEQVLTAFAIAGGMPRYLSEFARSGDPLARMLELCVDPHGPLFDEPRSVLAQELDVPHVYFSILAVLASGPQPWADIVSRSRIDSKAISRYLSTLENLSIVAEKRPVTDDGGTGRNRRYEITDGFMRFWFRFVFPFQADLEAGVAPGTLFTSEIEPSLAGHIAPTIEEVARDWVRRTGVGGATKVGSWWGPAPDELRRSDGRTSEEIDIVGVARGRVSVIGEVRWRDEQMGEGILRDIDRFKLPALRKAANVVARPTIVLVSRRSFAPALRELARTDPRLRLVELDELVATRGGAGTGAGEAR